MVLVSIGGGITQDITGFLASTLYRGIRWIFIPTTLLAQSDSCIGSKTSLNYRNYKNLIGTFYPPCKVNVDIRFISTQNNIDFYSGLGEIVKLHVTGGRSYSDYIIDKLPLIMNRQKEVLLKAVRNSLLIKKSYIETDEFDKGRRNLLNYGHCFGHAIETATNFKITHGQAVVLGMILANIVAQARGLLSSGLADRLMNSALMPLIPDQCIRYYSLMPKIIVAMRKDKKRTGSKLPLIVLKDGYRLVKINDLTDIQAGSAVKKLDRLLQARNR
jgi:3-dehydroquinate synthase